MTAALQAHRLYKTTQRDISSDKNIELNIITNLTARLRTIDMNEIGAMTQAAPILVDNARFWTVLYTDLLNPDNPFPLDLKNGLLALGEFVQRQTRLVLQGGGKVDVLIDINQSVIKGLLAQSQNNSNSALSERQEEVA